MNPIDKLKYIQRAFNDQDIYLGDITFDDIEYGSILSQINYALAESGIVFCYGATRGCFVMDDEDYVFKFDFAELEGGSYCESEAFHYNLAKKYGFDKIFLPIKEILEVNGASIYLQKKANYGIGQYDILTVDEEKEYLSKVSDVYSLCNLPPVWIKHFIDTYGEEEFEKFKDFIELIGINDLHSNNIGIDINSKPFIFDYAGYFEES